MSDLETWKSQAQEELSMDQSPWEFFAYRAASTSSESKDLLNSTRTHIALTYLHKLAS